MKNLYAGFQRFMNDEEGVTAIEYALIASLIAVVIIAALRTTATGICKAFSAVSVALGGAAVTC